MSDYQILLEKRKELDAKISSEFKRLRAESIGTVKQLCQMYDIGAADIFAPQSQKTASSVGVAKYRDPATGATWTGRGKPPNWIVGKDRTPFQITPA